MTPAEEKELRTALVTIAHALGMDEAEAFRTPLRFALRAGSAIYLMRQEIAMLTPVEGPRTP